MSSRPPSKLTRQVKPAVPGPDGGSRRWAVGLLVALAALVLVVLVHCHGGRT